MSVSQNKQHFILILIGLGIAVGVLSVFAFTVIPTASADLSCSWQECESSYWGWEYDSCLTKESQCVGGQVWDSCVTTTTTYYDELAAYLEECQGGYVWDTCATKEDACKGGYKSVFVPESCTLQSETCPSDNFGVCSYPGSCDTTGSPQTRTEIRYSCSGNLGCVSSSTSVSCSRNTEGNSCVNVLGQSSQCQGGSCLVDSSPTVTIGTNKSQYVVGETIIITVVGSDDKDISILEAHYGGSWHNQPCDSTQTTCTRTFSTSEASAGSYTYTGNARDNAGQGADPKTVSISVIVPPDYTAPTGLVLIAGGADVVSSNPTWLFLSCDDAVGCVAMKITDDFYSFDSVAEQDFTPYVGWPLSSGDGIKTVYVRFRDAAGNWSGTVFDNTRLITIACSVPLYNSFGIEETGNSLRFSWGAISGALNYKAILCSTMDCSAGALEEGIASGVEYTFTDLPSSTSYVAKVRVEEDNNTVCNATDEYSSGLVVGTTSCEKTPFVTAKSTTVTLSNGECSIKITPYGADFSDLSSVTVEVTGTSSTAIEVGMSDNPPSCGNDIKWNTSWSEDINELHIGAQKTYYSADNLLAYGFRVYSPNCVFTGTPTYECSSTNCSQPIDVIKANDRTYLAFTRVGGSSSNSTDAFAVGYSFVECTKSSQCTSKPGKTKCNLTNDAFPLNTCIDGVPPTSKIIGVAGIPGFRPDFPFLGDDSAFLNAYADGWLEKNWWVKVQDSDNDGGSGLNSNSCYISINEGPSRLRACTEWALFTVGRSFTGADCDETGNDKCRVRVWAEDNAGNVNNTIRNVNDATLNRNERKYIDGDVVQDANEFLFGVDWTSPFAQ